MNMNTTTNIQVNRQELLEVLYAASSQNPVQVQASTERLKALLDKPGTYDALHDIAAEKSYPQEIRQQSIIQFKNSANSHWRSRKLLSEEHRHRIRERCMVFLHEEDDMIAACNELIVAKIARLDYPHHWPLLLTNLLSAIEGGLQSLFTTSSATMYSTLVLRRTLSVLNATLKELSTMRMMTGIKTMGEITSQICGVLLIYYSQLSLSQLTPILSPSDPKVLSYEHTLCVVLVAHLIYKCLVKLALWSWPRLTRVGKDDLQDIQGWFMTLFQSSTAQLKMLSEQRISFMLAIRFPNSDPIVVRTIDKLTRHVRTFGKFFSKLQRTEPGKFIELPTCNDVVLYYWSKVVYAANGPPDMIKDSFEAVCPVRFLVQAMVLFKGNLARWTPFRKGGPVTETTLSQQFVEDAVRLLVTRFIPLNPTDLESWMADPEDWVNEEDKENDHWEYELRSCSERVLMTLASQYRDYVVPLMKTTFQDIISQSATDLQSIVRREAIYCAIGRCASRLQDDIDFPEWTRRYLMEEAKGTNPNCPIIKRRIAWLIGTWVGGMSTPVIDPFFWKVLVHLLCDRGEGTDAAVRFTAANALRECVDTIAFDITQFSPFLPSTITELLKLMHEVDTMEMKQRLAKSLNVIIEQAHSHIVPHVQMIAEGIPVLWTAAGEEWLFKGQLLVIVTSLITSAQGDSILLVPLIVPLVQESLSPGVAVNLDEDALNLWSAALRNAPGLQDTTVPNLLQLFPLATSLLAGNLDLLGKIILIVESYFFAGAPLVLQNFASDLMNAVTSVLSGKAIETNQQGLLATMNFMIQIAPASLWGEAMHHSGFFSHVVKILDDDKSSSAMLTECIFVLARIAVADCGMFLRLVAAAAQANGVSEEKIWGPILDQYWRQFDHMAEPRHRKLCAMGIAAIVSTGRPEALERIPNEISNLWTDVLCEARESLQMAEGGDESELKLYWDANVVPMGYYAGSEDTMEYERRKFFYESDPVRTAQLTSYVAAALRQAEMACGGTKIFKEKYLDKTDPTVLMQLEKELTGHHQTS